MGDGTFDPCFNVGLKKCTTEFTRPFAYALAYTVGRYLLFINFLALDPLINLGYESWRSLFRQLNGDDSW